MDEQTAQGKLRLQLHGVFQPFMVYGLQTVVPEAIEAVVNLAEAYHLARSDKDVPIIYTGRLKDK